VWTVNTKRVIRYVENIILYPYIHKYNIHCSSSKPFTSYRKRIMIIIVRRKMD